MSSVNDPIADMLTRVRNANAAGLEAVEMEHSRLNEEIAKVLKREGYLADVRAEAQGVKKALRLVLRYTQDKKPVLLGLRRISKPGLRRYTTTDKIQRVRGGMGISILSTSRGVMTDKEARRSRLGGEVLCQVW